MKFWLATPQDSASTYKILFVFANIARIYILLKEEFPVPCRLLTII